MKTNLTINHDKSNTSAVRLILQGSITSANADVLMYKLDEAVRNGDTNFILNMRQIRFMASGGIRVLLSFYKKAKKLDGSFYVEDPSENVRNVLGMTALDEMLLK